MKRLPVKETSTALISVDSTTQEQTTLNVDKSREEKLAAKINKLQTDIIADQALLEAENGKEQELYSSPDKELPSHASDDELGDELTSR